MTCSKRLYGALLIGFATALPAGITVLHAENPAAVKHLLNSKECAGCDLRNAQLTGTNLNAAYLVRADFRDASLAGTTLRNAVLKGASFFGADLTGADLTGATDANLAGAITNEQTICPGGQPGPCAG